MKRFLFFLMLLIAAAGLLAQTTLTWNGSYTTDWEDPTNWTPNAIPSSTTDVIIASNGFGRYPVIDYTSGTCLNLSLNDGVPLTLNVTASLTVLGWAELGGNLMLSGSGGVTITGDLSCYNVVSVTGTGQLTVLGNATWYSGSSLVDAADAVINLYKDLSIVSGADFTMTNGGSVSFKGTVNSNIRNYSAATQFGNLTAAKNVGSYVNIHLDTTQPFKINNNLVNNSGNRFYCSKDIVVTLLGNLMDYNLGDTTGTPGFKWNAGTLKMDGTYQYIDLQGLGSYLNHLVCSATTGVLTEYELDLRGNLTIESGYLSVDGVNNILISGSWNNQVGPDGFIEGAGRVIFNNSSTWQTILSDETFNILEVNMAAALRFTAGKTVTCAVYDWTAGGIDMNTGATFTALDLAETAIVGNWWLTHLAGTINISNNDGGEVHLHGSLTISAGIFNVYNTNTYANDSAWGSYGNGSLTMSGGLLDFKTVGILVSVLSPYTLTLNITGGTIRTVGNFECFYSGFAPSDGTLEMYEYNSKSLNMSSGTLHHLKINKGTGVYLNSSTTCNGDLTITAGTFNTGVSDFSCNNLYVYGSLVLASHMTVNGECVWGGGCTTDIASGATLSTPGNWFASVTSNPIFPAGSDLYFYGTSARMIQNYSSTATYGHLHIGEDRFGTTYSGGVYSLHASSTHDLVVPGGMRLRAGNTLDLNNLGMNLGDALNLWGTLIIDSGTVTVNSGLVMSGSAVINIDTGTLYLVDLTLTIPSGAVVTLASGTIKCDGINAAGTFQPAGGTVLLYSLTTSNKTVSLAAGNWLPSLSVNGGSKVYYLLSDITIKGSFTLLWGQFAAYNISTGTPYNIYITGNWTNNQSPNNFHESTGRVIFNGGGFQAIKTTETFNIIEVNKVPSGGGGDALRIESGFADLNIVVTCNQYDWTAGALDVYLRGTFTALDLADNGLYGDYTCNAGCGLNLTDDTNINLFGEMHVFGGEVNVFCTNAAVLSSYWPAAASAWIEISGGSLNFRNKGIWLQNGYALTENISGGIISMTGNFVGRRDNFNPIGGTFALYGDANSTIDFDVSTSSFYDLLINKSSSSAQVELTSGATIPLICRRNFTINRGNFYMNRETLHCFGDLNINNGGEMSFASFNDVKLAANKNLNVNDGGMIYVYGSTADQITKFSHISDGYFYFNVNAGGHLAANYVLFEYLNSNGVYIKPGAFVDGLHHCTFQYGIAGDYLFRVDNDQVLTITYANFPTDAGSGSNNVWKSLDTGKVYFSNYSGAFSGSGFERDVFYRIFWMGADMNLTFYNVVCSRPDDYVCAPQTVRVYVENTGSNDIIDPIRIDLYKNSLTAPPAGSYGDLHLELPALEPGQIKLIEFTNVSSDVAETWNSWIRVDTDNAIPETNETDNIWTTAISTTWLPLPVVDDLAITQTGANTARLNWTYPVIPPVARYNVYRSDDPYFTSGVGTPWAQTTSNFLNTITLNDKWFYLIKAERDLPLP